MKLRNPLFAPADSERKVAKALASAADAVILDLEDSIAPSGKEVARAAAVGALGRCDRSRVIVRINSSDTRWYLPDLVAIVAACPAAILLPKCTGGDDLRRLDHHITVLECAAGFELGTIRVLALATETVASVQAMRYAGVSERLIGLCFGAEDLSADLGVDVRGAGNGYPVSVAAGRSALLMAAAEACVPAIDTPWPDPKNVDGLEKEARAAAFDGFVGKLCIHPDQIIQVASIFTPAPERIAWARAVHEHFAANPEAGVLTMNGKMIDQPHAKLAERILASAGE
jgi:citrate lyase subunit beta / citryl-CoA lyase